MNENFQIRQARPDDENAIRQIAGESYAIYLGRMEKKPFPLLDNYALHIANGNAFVLVNNGAIRGYIILMTRENDLLPDNLAVAPDCQKLGPGRALVKFAEEMARKNGLSAISLYTNEAMTENLAWYARQGFEEMERREEKGCKRVFFRKKLT